MDCQGPSLRLFFLRSEWNNRGELKCRVSGCVSCFLDLKQFSPHMWGCLSPNPLTRHSRTLWHQGWGCARAEQGQLLCWPWCLHRVLLAPAEHGVGFQTFRMGRKRAEPTAGVGCHILIWHKWQFSLESWGLASGNLILHKVTGDEQVSLSKDT